MELQRICRLEKGRCRIVYLAGLFEGARGLFTISLRRRMELSSREEDCIVGRANECMDAYCPYRHVRLNRDLLWTDCLCSSSTILHLLLLHHHLLLPPKEVQTSTVVHRPNAPHQKKLRTQLQQDFCSNSQPTPKPKHGEEMERCRLLQQLQILLNNGNEK